MLMNMNAKRAKVAANSSSSNHTIKRENQEEEQSCKRMKIDKTPEEDIQSKKRRNFVTACQRVSYESYFDQRSRFQLVYLPVCSKDTACVHQEYKNGTNIKPIPSYAEESFKIETKTNMWCEALEVCFLSVTSDQFLSANVLKDIVEIMMNAHEDSYADYTIEYLLDKCQTILSKNFSTHPPCLVKSLRKCYNNFLTSPLDLKENTFTNRTQYGHDKGIVKYCLNRLEYEISTQSCDEPLVNKYENIPEEMKQSVKGLHWQKEKFEIFELLKRTDRIERIMYVLESIIELLQFDLAIWHSRYTHNLGRHIMRSHKPLMAYILWSNNVLYTGAVNNNCRQILRLFVHMVHLKYPSQHIRIMVNWLNCVIQTFYICENNSNSDYPNTGKYCTAFANEFYKIISEMPHDSIIRILEAIQPNYMQHLIATLHVKELLSTQEDDIVKIVINFIKNSQWQLFEDSNEPIHISKKMFPRPKKVKNLVKYIEKICADAELLEDDSDPSDSNLYPKYDSQSDDLSTEVNINHVVHSLYVALDAYLDAFSVLNVQETLSNLNEQLLLQTDSNSESQLQVYCSYTVTEVLIKKYRSIYKLLKELMIMLNEMRNSGNLPDVLKVFDKIGLLS